MDHQRKRILIFTDWYLPGYKAGGPIRSLANMITTLDHDFYIVTRNTDLHSDIPYRNIETGKWNVLNSHTKIWYFEEKDITFQTMKDIMLEGDFDWVYLNSLFSKKFTLLPLRIARQHGMSGKVLLAPRGMLKKGALSVKARKKKIFLVLSGWLGWFRGITWHATSGDEEKEIIHHFGKNAVIRCAPNLSLVPGESDVFPEKKRGELKLLCIARISPEKGIKEAITFLREAQLQGNVSVDFYGTQQSEEYLNECKSLAGGIPYAIIRFPGPVASEDIPDLMKEYQFFYLATMGENFGHAIVEAMMSSLPVIISNTTPWKNISGEKAGWDLPLKAEAFSPVLNYCMNMENNEYRQWRKGARQMGLRIAEDKETLEQNRRLFD